MADAVFARSTLTVGDRKLEIHRLDALQERWDVARLPYTLRILLENVLRNGDGDDVAAVAGWVATDEPSREISFAPARVLLQDFTGVPAVVDLAAMRNAMADLGGQAEAINPLIPVELVIDHSVQVDVFGTSGAFARNVELEFERNRERYAFLRWGQKAFRDFKVVPPGTGIVHQVNLEFLARVVALVTQKGYRVANIDVTVMAERPKLMPHVQAMREKLASVLQIDVDQVNIKAKTNEGLESVGRGEAMAAQAVALLILD